MFFLFLSRTTFFSRLAKQKNFSASTNMAQIFTGGRSVYFLLKIFYMQIRYANLYFSLRAGNSNSGTCTGSLAARRKSLPGRACTCVRRLTVYVYINELEFAVSSFFGSSSAWSFSTMMWKKTWRRSSPARSLDLKCEACNSKTRYLQAQPATPRAMWHPRPLAEEVLCKKADRYCHWHRRRQETAD